jgi:hypothetical protein
VGKLAGKLLKLTGEIEKSTGKSEFLTGKSPKSAGKGVTKKRKWKNHLSASSAILPFKNDNR